MVNLWGDPTKAKAKLNWNPNTTSFEDLVLVNSPTYGGGGIYNQVTLSTSDHPTFKKVLVHEFGHGYAGLGDEYSTDEYDPMYPGDTEPWEPNLTTLKDFQSKWADMMPKGMKIPTPLVKLPDHKNIRNEKEQKKLNEAVFKIGVFEGAGNQSKHLLDLR